MGLTLSEPLFDAGQFSLQALPLVSIKDALQLLQILLEEQVLLGTLCLAAQAICPGTQLVQNIVDALQIALRFLDASQRLGTLAQVWGDAGGLLKEDATSLGAQRKGRVHHALSNDSVGASSQSRDAQDVKHVAITHAVAVQQILVFARTVGASSYGNFTIVDG